MNGVRVLLRRAAELVAAVIVAATTGSLTLLVIEALGFDGRSWLPETVGATLAAAVVVLGGWLLLRRGSGERSLWLLGTAGPAFLAASHLGFLLAGTPHYLFGLGGDQLNRVAYVTRFADSPAIADPFYADAAPFYPPQWFWVGGRLAALTGIDGWEFYKPYAILTMAVAGAIACVTWRWLVSTRLAVLLGLVTVVVGGQTNAYEPYSWILICLLPQVVVGMFLLCARAAARVRPGPTGGPTWPLVVTIGAYLGWAALTYTLIAGFAALLVALVVVVHLWRFRAERAVVTALVARLVATAALSVVIALAFWHRYLLAVLGGAPTEPSVATDFAPSVGSRWPLPMFEISALGILCLIGLVWLVITVWPAGPGGTATGWPLPSPDRALDVARALTLMVVAVFGWFVLSGLRAATGSTLLPFRMIPVITLALAVAGVIGALALARWAVNTASPGSRGRVTAAAVVVAGLAAVQMVQHVSEEDAEFAATARETPGPPDEVLTAIAEMTAGREPSDLVILTSDPALYSYRPFFSFQAPAQAYATPAGRYEERTDQIRRWADSDSPAELADALEAGPFRAPDVLVLDREHPRRWVVPVMINEMPLTHNNRREEIRFRPQQFADPHLFEVRRVGSLMVIVRR